MWSLYFSEDKAVEKTNNEPLLFLFLDKGLRYGHFSKYKFYFPFRQKMILKIVMKGPFEGQCLLYNYHLFCQLERFPLPINVKKFACLNILFAAIA